MTSPTGFEREDNEVVPRLMRTLILTFVGVRLIYAAMLQLIPDEATYWVWSRHLAASYFDHPPMVAYLIRAGTYLLGNNELGVRIGGVFLTAGSIIVTLAIARRILRDDRAVMWVGLIWLSSPLLAGIGTFTTPDTPMVFFSVCALAFAVRIADRDDRPAPEGSGNATARDWLLFGLFTGLALVSKYTAILLPAAVMTAMILSNTGRVHFRRPWIYLSSLVALAVFSPVIWWNFKHHWASFAYQLHHGTTGQAGSEIPITPIGWFWRFGVDLATYAAGQAGAWTPVLFIVSVMVAVVYFLRHRSLGQVDRVLLWTGAVPLVFFGLMYLKSHRGEANWPAFGYFPISLLIGRWLVENWAPQRIGAVKAGVLVALGILIVMHVLLVPRVTQRLVRLPFHVPHAISDLVVWRERGRALGDLAGRSGLSVVANRHEDAAEAAFYMPGQPDVWCVSIGSRPTAYDYFDDPPDFAKIPGVFWIGGHVDLFEREYGFVEQSRSNLIFMAGHNQTSMRTYVLVRPQR